MPQFYVVGNPITHSLSPVIHQAFATSLGLSVDYDKKALTHETFESFVKKFFEEGGRGLNITTPFKSLAYQIAENNTEEAIKAQSVNTLWYENNQLCGDTTDGRGLVEDLKTNYGFKLNDKNILVLGTGGAAYAILPSLLKHNPRNIYIWGRTREKAEELITHFSEVTNLNLFTSGTSDVDLILHATSAGLQGDTPTIVSTISIENALWYDLSYGAAAEPFLQAASQFRGARVADGLGMLVEQAALSFERWHGKKPAANLLTRLKHSVNT